MMYSFGFHGYLDCIQGIQRGIREKRLGFSRFTAKKTKKGNSIQGNYYACLKDVDHVKNTVQLKKHMILSGPNASGKTTMIKSVFINILLTQQFGCGFYESATIRPYHHFHCYLNIPDTSGRDSLFQAEARRCKEIIDEINEKDEMPPKLFVDPERREQAHLFHHLAQQPTGLLVPLYVYPGEAHTNQHFNRLIDLKRRFEDLPPEARPQHESLWLSTDRDAVMDEWQKRYGTKVPPKK
jgi:hypothetical protein